MASNNTYPKATVSVLIPTFNAESSIRRCIESVYLQTYRPTEVLVYDDASNDSTRCILRDLESEYDNLIVFYGIENMGAGHARTEILSRATSDLIAFLDADDLWEPNKLERQVQFMEEHSLDICVCSYSVFDNCGKKIGERRPPKSITLNMMKITDWIPTSMSIFKSSLQGCRKMPSIRRRQDYGYWLLLFRNNPGMKCGSVDENLGRYFRSSGSLSSNPLKNIYWNYKMFRQVMQYSIIVSAALVTCNILVRVLRT